MVNLKKEVNMKIFSGFFLIFVLTISTCTRAEDRQKEIDLAYSKIVNLLPTNAQLIHNPYSSAWQTYGENYSVTSLNNSEVIGGDALLVNVKRKGKNPWDVGAFANIQTDIEKGDVIYLILWVRLNSNTVNATGGLQLAVEPYSYLVSEELALEDQWQTYAMAVKAEKKYKKDEIRLHVQLSQKKQKVELGPTLVFNLGKEADLTTLPLL
ncbi:hypothetical protein [Alteromonas oceanisediminis]|uniref:hypothetical protein n=1 Tax=Alteromonas oceanisediminis TaxID=2836180 RepID=UPI001BDA02A3|nr:hypothetical protein [Alteromonas oceanisediminis]MBT0586287.1 hypothetical protein [Alteromonas oceanisediminis]